MDNPLSNTNVLIFCAILAGIIGVGTLFGNSLGSWWPTVRGVLASLLFFFLMVLGIIFTWWLIYQVTGVAWLGQFSIWIVPLLLMWVFTRLGLLDFERRSAER